MINEIGLTSIALLFLLGGYLCLLVAVCRLQRRIGEIILVLEVQRLVINSQNETLKKIVQSLIEMDNNLSSAFLHNVEGEGNA